MEDKMTDNTMDGWEEPIEEANRVLKVAKGMELVPLGGREAVKEIARRLERMAPLEKYTLSQCVVISQFALSFGANPLPAAKEIYLMRDRSGNVIGITTGIALFRRRANEKDKADGDERAIDWEILRSEEFAQFQIPEGSLAVKCKLTNKLADLHHAQLAKMYADSGAPWQEIKVLIGDRPCIEGIGFLTPAEMETLDRNSSNKFSHIERAKKRAEAASLRVKYHLPFGTVQLSDNFSYDASLADDYIDARAHIVDVPAQITAKSVAEVTALMDETEGVTTPDPVESEEERTVKVANARASMYPEGDPIKKRVWPDKTVETITNAFELKSDKQSVATLNLSPFLPSAPIEEILAWAKLYKQGRAAGLDTKQAAAQATAIFSKKGVGPS
jgi:hypothetical protein